MLHDGRTISHLSACTVRCRTVHGTIILSPTTLPPAQVKLLYGRLAACARARRIAEMACPLAARSGPQAPVPVASAQISLPALLQDCLQAAELGMAQICAVHRERENGGQDVLQGTLKEALDPKSVMTKADTQAQVAILSILSKWRSKGVHFVCEEDETPAPQGEGAPSSPSAPAAAPAAPTLALEISEELCRIPAEEVCVFIDPLDGTREFVEGRLEAVQTLIGIAVRGRPVVGVMGLPFYPQSPVVYGAAGRRPALFLPPSLRPEAEAAGRGTGLIMAASAGVEASLQPYCLCKHPIHRAPSLGLPQPLPIPWECCLPGLLPGAQPLR